MDELISIIVPIYNVEKYLEKCIKSIINQTYKNIEIILVDDGSPDNCAKICDEYKERDSRIVVIHKQNGGLSDARNAGIDISKGSYLSFVDSDDYILPEFIEKLFSICKNNNVMISQCSYIETKEDDVKNELIITGLLEKNYKEMIEGIYYYKENIVVWNKLYKKELFEKIRFPEGKIHEDEFTVYKLYYLAKRAIVVNDKLYCYRIAPGSITRSGFNIKRLAVIDAYEERMTFLKEKNEDELFLKTMKEYYYMLLDIYSKISKKSKEYSKEIISIKKSIKDTKNVIIKTKEFNFKFKLFVFLTSILPRLSFCFFNFLDSIKKSIKDRIPSMKKVRKFFRVKCINKKLAKKLENREFTILSNNCIAGVIYKDLGQRFLSPTINLYIKPSDFVKFLENMDKYLEEEIIELNCELDYPVGKLGDITIFFIHYDTFENAKNKWNERKLRIKKDNLYVIMTDRYEHYSELFRRFNNLDFKNKVCFTKKHYPEFESCVRIKKHNSSEYVGIITDIAGIYCKRLYEYADSFYYIDWINKGAKKI